MLSKFKPTGQANYGWGNMVCEMLCESRRRAGRPGLAVSWGAVAGVGYLEEVLKVMRVPFQPPSAAPLIT